MSKKFLRSLDDFAAWIASHEEGTRIGVPSSMVECPLAQWLRTMHPGAPITVTHLCAWIDDEPYLWPQEFMQLQEDMIERVGDDLDDYITRDQCLYVISRVPKGGYDQ